MSLDTRPAAVAGSFYPAEAERLRDAIHEYVDDARDGDAPRALISPHAGYVYSGPVAGSAFATVCSAEQQIERVVVIGPSHFTRFPGLALPGCETLCTPLGELDCDREAAAALLELPFVHELSEAHAREHCVEVELPFIQELLGEVRVVALVTGDATVDQVTEALDAVWERNALVVVSSDLCHYLPYEEARAKDRETADAILGLDPDSLDVDSACGRLAVKGLLQLAKARDLSVDLLDLRNSGDTAGPRDQVVGYGAFAFR